MRNDSVLLRGNLTCEKYTGKVGRRELSKGAEYSLEHLEFLNTQIEDIIRYWEEKRFKMKPLFSIRYNSVVPKGKRINGLIVSSLKDHNDAIVGARYVKLGDEYSLENELEKSSYKKHQITYSFELDTIKKANHYLTKIIDSLKNKECRTINGSVVNDLYHDREFTEYIGEAFDISKTKLNNILVDAYYIEEMFVDIDVGDISETSIVTFYDNGVPIKEILSILSVDPSLYTILGDRDIVVAPSVYRLIKQEFPALIAMSCSDIQTFIDTEAETVEIPTDVLMNLPDPQDDTPTIGVIDSGFNPEVPFARWIEFDKSNILFQDITTGLNHGIAVSSIIIDGPALNPKLDDGCGRFKVRYFQVPMTQGKKISTYALTQRIRLIVEANLDIKVWNISIGSEFEIDPNFVSYQASILDEIQYEHDVIFVIAGTNKLLRNADKIGAPADSINSLVVNSVGLDHQPPPYARRGPVLSFFQKPDVSYYGGTSEEPMRVFNGNNSDFLLFNNYNLLRVKGTSFAAPWIARKLSYLIDKLGINREVAKALIIDSAVGWKKIEDPNQQQLIGHGVVPIHIRDIITSPKDEIKLMIFGLAREYHNFNYHIPVPMVDGKFPFTARATLCYFPKCSRSQGVDYTNTELDFMFGRTKLMRHNGKTVVDNIKSNARGIKNESNSRDYYRKWDNVKILRENMSKKPRAKQSLGRDEWGISVKVKERLNGNDGKNLKFGVVVTLKEINGKNHHKYFVNLCRRRWNIITVNEHSINHIQQLVNESISVLD